MRRAGKWIRKNVLYPIHAAATGRPVLKYSSILEDSQWWSEERLSEFQWEKLQALLIHAQTKVPYYARMFADAGVDVRQLGHPNELPKLPILTKALIRSNLHDMIARGADTKDLMRDSTGGSTGENVIYYVDQRARTQRQAVVVRNNRWAGLDIGEKEVLLWGSPFDIKAYDQLKGRIKAVFHNRHLLSAYELKPDTMALYAELLRKWKPDVITSYSSAMDVFSRYLIDKGITDIRPRGLIMSAEVLFPHVRERLESVFGCRVYNRYGCREFGAIAHECEHGGFHINMERVFVEIVPAENCPPELEPGELLITDLDCYAMPMIRYRIGDISQLAGPGISCKCGRGLRLLGQIQGRTMDVVPTLSGRMLPGTFWTLLSRSVAGVIQFQVVQKDIDHLVMNLKTDNTFRPEYAETLRETIIEHAGPETRVDVNLVDEIPRAPSGKFRFIISELDKGRQ